MQYFYLALGVWFTVAQALFYFMLVAFSISEGTSKSVSLFINFFLYLLPLVCLIATILLLQGFFSEWKYVYSWIFLPIPFAVIFVIIRLVVWQ